MPQDPQPPVQDSAPPTAALADGAPAEETATDFGSRGRARRRARFLRKARELAYRDLGGLVFNLHRFGARNDALVLNKLTALGRIDGELRALEAVLGQREQVTVLREAGITACPRCAAIHSSEDRFCPHCGLSMGRHPDLPIGAAAQAPPPQTPPPSASPAPPPAQAPPAAAPQAAAPAAPVGPPTATYTPPAPPPQQPTGAPVGEKRPATAPTRSEAPRSPSPPRAAVPPAAQEEPTEIIHPPTPDP
jgi:hypothetical protein